MRRTTIRQGISIGIERWREACAKGHFPRATDYDEATVIAIAVEEMLDAAGLRITRKPRFDNEGGE
jgi:hypothetical protein